MNSWAIVNFLEDKSVEAVPNFWFKNNLCVWPSKRSTVKHCILKRSPIDQFEHEWLKARMLGLSGRFIYQIVLTVN